MWILIISLFFSPVHAGVYRPMTKEVKVVDSCKKTKSKKQVFIFKQWHLSSEVDTKNKIPAKIPQRINQKNLYHELLKQIENKKIATVVAEGCEGVIDKNFKHKFNQWGYANLLEVKESSAYEDIMTHIPLKLEVIFGDKLQTFCGDNYDLIQKQLLAFSEMRGVVGFYI